MFVYHGVDNSSLPESDRLLLRWWVRQIGGLDQSFLFDDATIKRSRIVEEFFLVVK